MEVAVSESRIEALYNRLKQYEKLGLFPKSEGKIRAFIHIFTKENVEKGERLNKIAEEVSRLEEVKEVNILTGQWDLLIKVEVNDVRELAYFVVEKLRKIPGVERTITSIILRSISK